MNKEKILAVADAIEAGSLPALGFNMDYEYDDSAFASDYNGTSCGAVACIIGWTNTVFPVPARHIGSGFWAGETLDLTPDKSDKLFYPDVNCEYRRITPAEAAETLRHLAETGEVDWSHVGR